MASSAEDTGLKKLDTLEGVFKNLAENIDIISKQIKGGQGTREHSDSFSPERFWTRVNDVFQILSKETTKLSLAFSKKPFPSPTNSQAMVVELEKAMLALTSSFYSLPISQGKTLRRSFQRSVIKILESLYSFATALLETAKSDSSSQRLVWTGGVWEATDFVVDKDNKTSVLKELASTGELVQDALGEIEEARESDGQMGSVLLEDMGNDEDDEGPTWSEQDKRVVDACQGLVKATKTVVKKCRERVQASSLENRHRNGDDDNAMDTSPPLEDSGDGGNGPSVVVNPIISVMDDVVDQTSRVSEMVDLAVCCIYAPINYTEIRENGQNLTALMLQILQFLRSSELTNNQDASWLDFLTTALEHNMEKLRKSTLPDQGHG